MKLILKFFLGLVSILAIIIVVFFAIYSIGHRIVAAPLEELLTLIDVGMSRSEVRAIMDTYEDMHDYGSANEMQLSQASSNLTSPIVGEWFCFAKIQIEEDVVKSFDDVFCVD